MVVLEMGATKQRSVSKEGIELIKIKHNILIFQFFMSNFSDAHGTLLNNE
jgi:hypothetical protein